MPRKTQLHELAAGAPLFPGEDPSAALARIALGAWSAHPGFACGPARIAYVRRALSAELFFAQVDLRRPALVRAVIQDLLDGAEIGIADGQCF